jgi:DNA-binding transcriptional MerR regulator
VNAIRHYHRLGLLDEPERRYNGYKQYGVAELVWLLRILRLVELGVPLAQIAEAVAGGRSTSTILREQSADLALRIEQLQQARADIAAILRYGAPTDAPLGFVSVASRISESDRAILHISNQFYDADAMADFRRMMELGANEVELDKQINTLPAGADEVTRARLAAALAPIIARHLVDYPWLMNPAEHLTHRAQVARQSFTEALAALYNPAQLDVLTRAGHLAQQ